ncbi:glycosyltransferase family 90 protein [Hypoxylon trugodes]|uniref:glycosyltransferase family 90 protein n=1 Tax=Hypoxylon trugodes TaxID=326681 RepID=UPI00219787D3|nr:glycosyltransferase family 90 protein [Hypoxylon trugodes]KAI1382709.1 glycosyltransferase family 90 protein [Hypoxylon trugodes]
MLDTRKSRDWLGSLPLPIPDSRIRFLRWQTVLRYAVIAFLISITFSGVFLFRRPEGFLRDGGSHYFEYFWNQTANHPIDQLISDAHTFHENLLKQQSFDIPTAAARYRDRRGRHPPPGFDAWFKYAVEHDAIVVESFFDRIYNDIAPFWGLDPQVTAARASSWEHVVRVRNGIANGTGNTEGKVPWLQLWTNLVAEAAPWLPDVDMPINYMDESRLIVPWEDITNLVEKERARRSIKPTGEVVTKYTGLSKVDAEENAKPYHPQWLGGSFWNLTRVACAPDSPSRNVAPMENFETLPTFPHNWEPDYSYKGYVRNFTASMDPCTQPHLRGLHGTFIEPLTESTSKELIPLFGGCKLPVNNEILIPGAMYITDDPFYSGGETHGPPWRQKTDGVVWRGVASGGRNKKENWMHFQRHRLIEMLNGTTVAGMEQNGFRAMTFEMPPMEKYDFPRRRKATIGTWLEKFSNAGFVNLLCFPEDSNCAYVRPYLSEVQGIPMKEQYKYKFMPDVDGNSFSARFRGFLLSTSLPIKATIYAEWHDDRLVPWLHFAPMDNIFQDLYAILDYFTRDRKGDKSARFIAEEGRAWGAKVLRREDMLLYVWRLLLEFARVCDEKRETLGYIDDLRPPQ